ncbi:hypothetical protein [Streptomyces sp. NPDC096339]|uniref:hypothetical protein n=1 Tax=Streptomyces sp. NPDC096339 TaxID=3366086 RepID=UPI0037F18A15
MSIAGELIQNRPCFPTNGVHATTPSATATLAAPAGIEIVNGRVPQDIKRKTSALTRSPIDRRLVCDTTAGGAFTGTLPAARFDPVEYVFKDVGSNNLTAVRRHCAAGLLPRRFPPRPVTRVQQRFRRPTTRTALAGRGHAHEQDHQAAHRRQPQRDPEPHDEQQQAHGQ